MKDKIILKNYLSRLVFSFFNIVLGFVVTPLLIKYLGKEDFSLFKISNDWLSSIGFIEQAATSSILAILFKASNEKRDHYTYFAFKKFLNYAVFFILISLFTIPFLPYLYQIPTDKLNSIRFGFAIGSLGFIFLPATVFKLWIEFHEKSYLLNKLRIIQNILQSVLAIILAILSCKIWGQFLSLFLGQLFFATVIFYYFKKNTSFFHEASLSHHEINLFENELKQTNKSGLILSTSSKISFFSDTLLLGFYFNPILILPFTLSQKLTQMIQENLQSLGNSSWASLIDLYRNNRIDEFNEQFNRLTNFISIAALSLLLPLIILNKSFITLWVGNQFYAGIPLTSIASINAYLMSIFSSWGWCLSGSGKMKPQIPIYIKNAIVNLIIGIVAINFFGVLGPIIGTLAGFILVYGYLFPKVLSTELNLDRTKLYLSLYGPLIYFVPTIFFAYYLDSKLNINNFISLALAYAFFSLGFAIILFFTLLTRSNRLILIRGISLYFEKIKTRF